MCIAIPKLVIRIDEGKAVIIDDGNELIIDITLIDGVQSGDYIIIQSGIAVQYMSEIEAIETLKIWKEAKESIK